MTSEGLESLGTNGNGLGFLQKPITTFAPHLRKSPNRQSSSTSQHV
jgi:hypothetical protein